MRNVVRFKKVFVHSNTVLQTKNACKSTLLESSYRPTNLKKHH